MTGFARKTNNPGGTGHAGSCPGLVTRAEGVSRDRDGCPPIQPRTAIGSLRRGTIGAMKRLSLDPLIGRLSGTRVYTSPYPRSYGLAYQWSR